MSGHLSTAILMTELRPMRRRPAALLSIAASLLFHSLLLNIGAMVPSLAATVRSRPHPPSEEEIKRRLPFILVDESRTAADTDPRKAVAFGDRNLRAAEERPDPALVDGSPRSHDHGHILAERSGRRGMALSPLAAISPPTRQDSSVQRSVAPRAEEKPQPAKSERYDRDGPQPPAARREMTAPEDANAPQPAFENIGDRNPPGEKRKNNTATGARLVGSPSFETLRAKWGAYMRQVALQLRQACRRQESIAHRSFRCGTVQMAFGISADGNIENIRLIAADDDMLAERRLARDSLEDAAPFPPLTPEMQKDENFKNIVVNFIFE